MEERRVGRCSAAFVCGFPKRYVDLPLKPPVTPIAKVSEKRLFDALIWLKTVSACMECV